MKREELKTLDLLCDMGIDVNGNRNLQPWKAYDIDEVNIVINELEAENERLERELKQMDAQDQVVIDGILKENAKMKILALHAMSKYFSTMFKRFMFEDRFSYYGNKYREAYLKAKKVLMEGK